MKPTVSLSLPVYNGERYLSASIQSILEQDYDDFELIITDNASTDLTESICRKFSEMDHRIRYFRNSFNLGAGPNFTLGLRFSSGKYFKWCAHDDIISRNYIAECIRALEEDSDVVLAYGATQCIDEEGIPLTTRRSSSPDYQDHDAARRFYKIISKSIFDLYNYGDGEIFGVFRMEHLQQGITMRSYLGSDRSIVAEMALRGKFAYVPQATFFNRDHRFRGSRLPDPRQREQWISADATRQRGLEESALLKHLVEIAWRNRQSVRLHKTLPLVIVWILNTKRIFRLLSEFVGLISPSLRSSLNGRARWLISRVSPKSW